METVALYAVLSAHREEIISRWKAMVRGRLAPEEMSGVELVDHVPLFLDEVIAALRVCAGVAGASATPGESKTAAEHGEQRLRLGFSLDAVVREYGALRDAMLATAKAAGAHVSVDEAQTIFDSIISGIALAVSEYARQREAELQRQHNEHFAFIAHELRNPLSTSMLAMEQVKRRGELQAEARGAASLERGLRQMESLINQALNVARVASGIELRRSPVRLQALLEEIQLGVAADAEEKHIELRLGVERDEEVWLDVRLMRSALGNLVRNAVKYTPVGGTIQVNAGISAGQLHLEVQDACGGLPPGKVEQAFAPFVRLNKSEDGFGLGLAIAKQAVDAHGGSIRVQNLPGKGCIFVLDLPCVP